MERSEVQLKDQFDAFREALGEYVSPDTWNKITLRAWELMGVDLWNHVGCGCKVCRDCDPLTSGIDIRDSPMAASWQARVAHLLPSDLPR